MNYRNIYKKIDARNRLLKYDTYIYKFIFRPAGAAVKMDHFQAALDPRKQELLEARFLGARVSKSQYPFIFPFLLFSDPSSASD